MSRSQIRSNWADQSDSSDSEDTTHLLRDGQKTIYQATQDHERGLNRLGDALKRQKTAAHSLATEVDIHNEILEDIDQGMLATNNNIQKNTRNIKLVLKKSSTFFLWLIIVILAIVIVILAIW